MTAPNIFTKEIDISTRVPSSAGDVYGGIVVRSPKGEVGKPLFMTSDTDLLKYLTPNERVEVGYDMAFYSALAYLSKTNKLWVVRADNGSTYGGAIMGTVSNTSLTSVNLGNISYVNTGAGTGFFSIAGDVSAKFKIGDSIKIEGSTANDGVYTVASATFNTPNTDIIVNEEVLDDTVDGHVNRNSIVTPTNYEFEVTDALLITGSNQGSWANDIQITLFTYAVSPDIVKEEGAFQINVLKKSTGDLLETFICSRVVGAKDGYGQNIYVEDIVTSSNYINIIDNVDVPSDTALIEQTTPLSLLGALDGGTISDSHMQTALSKLQNKNEIPLTIIMDGGWTTVAYQRAMDALCQSRKDCVSCLSTPYSAENSSTYMTDIVAYRKTDLNLNSSYSALYTPNLQIQDRFNSRKIFVSPDGYAAAAIAETASNYEIWYAPAGTRRGMLNVLDVKRRFSEGELDLLYDNGINPIKFLHGRGIAIWGQKTLSSRPSALDRLNVRLMLVTVEPAVSVFLEDFLFEFNDTLTRLLVRSGIESYMDGIKSRKGVYAYTVVCDESNNTAEDIDNNKLNVFLYVQPTKTSEFITLSVIITRTGFTITT